MVDLSHLSRTAAMQAMALSKAPVIASHSSVRALVDHNRNLDDEQLLAVKRNGGVVQIVAYAGYLKAGARSGRRPIRETADRCGSGVSDRASGNAAIVGRRPSRREGAGRSHRLRREADRHRPRRHLVRLRRRRRHRGLGRALRQTSNVTIELVRRGYSEEDIAKLWGGNLLRVWGEVERVAQRLQAEAK